MDQHKTCRAIFTQQRAAVKRYPSHTYSIMVLTKTARYYIQSYAKKNDGNDQENTYIHSTKHI